MASESDRDEVPVEEVKAKQNTSLPPGYPGDVFTWLEYGHAAKLFLDTST